jgi:hypothetical protein
MTKAEMLGQALRAQARATLAQMALDGEVTHLHVGTMSRGADDELDFIDIKLWKGAETVYTCTEFIEGDES